MADSDLSAELQLFLTEHIDSYEQLEIVLLLRRRPDQPWSLESVVTELRLPEAIVEEALSSLRQRQLLVIAAGPEGPLFKYGPGTPRLAELVSELVEVYDERRLDIMRLMTANAIQRLRAKALSTFADAFLLRRRKGKDD